MSENLIIQKGSEPWFVGEKIADFLGFKNPLDALERYVSDENKSRIKNIEAYIDNNGIVIKFTSGN